MKNYVISMFKDYDVLWKMSCQWIKKYWIGWLIGSAIIMGAEMAWLNYSCKK